MTRTPTLAAALALSLMAGAAAAQDCTAPDADPYALDDAAIQSLYDCISEAMVAGYTKDGNEIAAAYRSWTATATRPAVAGPHGDRLLLTFANPAAEGQYLRFAYDFGEMPVGSILAKESIKIGKEGKAQVGPLFIMEKVAAGGAAEEYDNWVYSAVQPNGKPVKHSQAFCHDCHAAFEDQDSLAYPLEEVRISGAAN